MKEKSLKFLLESWGTAGGPNVYRTGIILRSLSVVWYVWFALLGGVFSD